MYRDGQQFIPPEELRKAAMIERMGPLPRTDSILHMHASGQRPPNANEFFLGRAEGTRNPDLRVIKGILQPHGPVGKFMKYWLAGLEPGVSENIVSRLQFGDRKFIGNDGAIAPEIIMANARTVDGRWPDFVDALVAPLFTTHGEALTNAGFGVREFEELRASRDADAPVSFEDAMVDIPLGVINPIMKTHGLPTYEITRFDPLDRPELTLKHISLAEVVDKYGRSVEQRQRRYANAFQIIDKALRSYVHSPTEQQAASILGKLHRTDPSFAELEIGPAEITARFHRTAGSTGPVRLGYKEQIGLADEIYRTSTRDGQSGDPTENYVDGENMMRAIFSMAQERGDTLVVQEFIRGTNWDLYGSLLSQYPEVNAGMSACRIWDRTRFPEFDLNLVRGLPYLPNRRVGN